jgi:hypothetical protein
MTADTGMHIHQALRPSRRLSQPSPTLTASQNSGPMTPTTSAVPTIRAHSITPTPPSA